MKKIILAYILLLCISSCSVKTQMEGRMEEQVRDAVKIVAVEMELTLVLDVETVYDLSFPDSTLPEIVDITDEVWNELGL